MAKTKEIVLYVLIVILAWLAYLVLKPFLSYIILGFLFAFLFYPMYVWLSKRMWDGAAAAIVMIVVLLVIVLPSVYLAGTLVSQMSDAYVRVQEAGIGLDPEGISNVIENWVGFEDVDAQVVSIFAQGRQILRDAIPGIITGTGLFLLGMFICFFILYYALREGDDWFVTACSWLPVEALHRKKMMELLRRQSKALLYGQILTSIITGIFVGSLMYFFSVPNFVFWAFLTILLGIIPVAGAFFVYVPVGIYLIVNDAWWQGITLIVLAVAFQLFVDYILRPKMVSKASEIHPTLVIIGALGGIAVMGFVGFLVGPLILSFFFILMDGQKG